MMQDNGTTKKKNRSRRRLYENREIYITAVFLGLILSALLVYFLYFIVFEKNNVTARQENNRYDSSSFRIIRGSILTSDRVIIAETEAGSTKAEDRRIYPYGMLFSTVTGYSSMGKTGLEASMNRKLLTSSMSFLSLFRNDLLERRYPGDSVITTIDSDLQYYCYQLLRERTGSITVMDPKTGAIRAMVSSPTFDANTVAEQWSELISSDNDTGNLLNRSTQGLYAPGSTFKLAVLMEYIRENPENYADFHYQCEGSVTIDGGTVHCEAGPHGDLDLKGTLAVSCNCAFIELGMSLDRAAFSGLLQELGFGEKLLSEIPSSISKVTISGDGSDFEMMQTAFGQGNTMETPLQNLLITCCIANDGILLRPFLVEKTVSSDGKYEDVTERDQGTQLLTKEQADYITECMKSCVYEGTSPQAGSSYCTVAGKSGSAQTSSSLTDLHAWFTAFAPAEDPELAITIMLENGGHGSPEAAPFAAAVFDYYYSRQENSD